MTPIRRRVPAVFLVLMLVTGGSVLAQERGLLLRVVPEDDTTATASATYRLSGSTLPGCTARINGSPMKIYPTGAFAALLRLQVGENPFVLSADDGKGRRDSLTFRIVRTPPLQSTRMDTLAIEEVMLEPSADQWVREGDLLRVQMKGTPGCTATFLDGFPMVEIPDSATGGIRGIYRGACVVTQALRLETSGMPMQLKDSSGASVRRSAPGTVKLLSALMPLVGVTVGERPFLNYGLGDDRLGGAKMGFLVPGVRLSISGKTGGQYRVALADNEEAWIPEDFVQLQPAGTPPPFTLTGSWNVYGDDRYDYVTVSLADRIPFAVSAEADPTRICVDLYGAVSNSNWITQHLTTQEIKNVDYRQTGKNVVRVVIELRHRQVWGYSVTYRGRTLVIAVRRQPALLRLDALTIALDAGHGGVADGAVGGTGTKEKEITLATVRDLQLLLEDDGARVVLTRQSDSSVSMADRYRTAIDAKADLLISVHANSIGSTTDPEAVRGTSTYYRYLCYRPLSRALYAPLLTTGLVPFGNVGGFNFSLNAPTEFPNALVELAFMSHPADEMLLLDAQFRKTLAEKIKDGLEQFLEECEEQ